MLNMDASDWFLLAGTVGLGAVAAVFHLSRKSGGSGVPQPEPGGGAAVAVALAVEDGQSLIDQLELDHLVSGCRDRMGFDSAIFEKDCLPLLQKTAEWTQRLPASESHHHAQPGGLITHMLESAFHALRFRQGYLLPVGAAPEEIPAKKHRWTYAVFLAALIHDIGRPLADLNVRLRRDGKPCGKWEPLAGSLVDQGVTHYTVDFEVKRDYDLHKRLPIILFQRVVPGNVLAWLAEDPHLMAELTAYLSGDEGYTGPLRDIVTKSDMESVRNNLLSGPRTRFAAAKTVPLIERLMQGLRLMLEEGRLSLNRAGSHGWIHDGKAWFVSKRLADEVRTFLAERESPEGIPGKDKNDRIFDTWQEYGAIIPTPEGRAVWSVAVALDEGWKQNLTCLCFNLDKLFPDPAKYPEALRGSVTPLMRETAEKLLQPNPETVSPLLQDESFESVHPDLAQPTEPEVAPRPEALPQLEPVKVEKADPKKPVGLPALRVGQPARSVAKKPAPVPASPPAALPVAALPTPEEDALPAVQAPAAEVGEPMPVSIPVPVPVPRATPPEAKSEFLDEAVCATPKPKKKNPAPVVLQPVVPAGHSQYMPSLGKATKEPSEAAIRFMRWIQDGISTGTLVYNRVDAMIHFVDEGMFLVSPLIFRHFAGEFGEQGDGKPSEKGGIKLGTGIQREVTKAGWNITVEPANTNILRYRVKGADGASSKLIAGVVIVDPHRFINPLPTVNPLLSRFEKAIEHA